MRRIQINSSVLAILKIEHQNLKRKSIMKITKTQFHESILIFKKNLNYKGSLRIA